MAAKEAYPPFQLGKSRFDQVLYKDFTAVSARLFLVRPWYGACVQTFTREWQWYLRWPDSLCVSTLAEGAWLARDYRGTHNPYSCLLPDHLQGTLEAHLRRGGPDDPAYFAGKTRPDPSRTCVDVRTRVRDGSGTFCTQCIRVIMSRQRRISVTSC